ncbi:MAG: DUF1801 domain-containing protein [Deltaproteobacteria bacterium]|nr:DUF1801 domain-containing protein [Deltaproteobacteria bacterium]
MNAGRTPIDEYLDKVPEAQRAALERVRRIIHEVAPEVEETISYRVPTFDLNGHLVGFAAFKEHCSLFPMDGSTVEAFASELGDYETSKGTIQFTLERPLPDTLIRRIVEARLAVNLAKKGPRIRKTAEPAVTQKKSRAPRSK